MRMGLECIKLENNLSFNLKARCSNMWIHDHMITALWRSTLVGNSERCIGAAMNWFRILYWICFLEWRTENWFNHQMTGLTLAANLGDFLSPDYLIVFLWVLFRGFSCKEIIWFLILLNVIALLVLPLCKLSGYFHVIAWCMQFNSNNIEDKISEKWWRRWANGQMMEVLVCREVDRPDKSAYANVQGVPGVPSS